MMLGSRMYSGEDTETQLREKMKLRFKPTKECCHAGNKIPQAIQMGPNLLILKITQNQLCCLRNLKPIV